MLNNSYLWPDKINSMIPADRVTFLGGYIKTFYNGGYWDRTQVEQAVAFGYITEELKN
ncbi:MAG: XkdX family protein [Clostridia bacterium]